MAKYRKITGTDKGDTLEGNAGNDELLGLGGDDILYGGGGDDTLYGDRGDDKLYGQDGNDALDGGYGDDKLYGHGGNDTLDGSWGDDKLYGHDGNDTLWGNWGDDVLDGGAGKDKLYDYRGNGKLYGRRGDDILYDGWGDSQHYGGLGDDILGYLPGAYHDDKHESDFNHIIGPDTGEWSGILNYSHGWDSFFGEGGDDIIAVRPGDKGHGGAGNDFLTATYEWYGYTPPPASEQLQDYVDGGSSEDIEDHFEWVTGRDLKRFLDGGPGADVFELVEKHPAKNSGKYADWLGGGYIVIGDFEDGVDRLQMTNFSRAEIFDLITIENNDNDNAVISYSDPKGGWREITLLGVDASAITEADFIT